MKTLLASILVLAACTNGDSKSDSTPMAASDVQFDNSTSGLASKNVQDALDDVIAMAKAEEDRASSSVIVCHYTTASLLVSNNVTVHSFTPSECGGTVPDAHYIGSISRLQACNNIYGFSVMNAGEPDGPGVQAHMAPCTGPGEIMAVFTRVN